MVTCPVLGIDLRESEFCSDGLVGIFIQGSGIESRGAAPALGADPVVSDSEYEFFLCCSAFAVVLTEEVCVRGMDLITHVDDLLGSLLAVFPSCSAGVDLGIEVHAAQESPAAALGRPRIRNGTLFRHCALI